MASIEIFCCYARKDRLSMERLQTHLMPLQRQGLITIWSDSNINAGVNWQEEIEKHLDRAQLILLLVSPDFIASDYCYGKEMVRAMDRHTRNEARVIPIILRPTHWDSTPFAAIKALPKDAKPITKWNTEDDALYDVVESIGNVVKELRVQRLFQDALERRQERHYAEALLLFDQCIILKTDHALAHLNKGQTLLALERYEESLVPFEEAVTIDATLADTYFYENKAIALKNLQRTDESLTAYDEAIRLDLPVRFPPSVRAVSLYGQKATLLSSLKRHPEALSLLKQLADRLPSAEIYGQIGDIQQILNRPYLALEEYQQAIDLITKQIKRKLSLSDYKGEYHHKKGQVLLQLQQFQEALETYEAAIAFNTFEEDYYLQKGKCLLELQRYSEALATFDERMSVRVNTTDYEHSVHKEVHAYFAQGKGKALVGLQRYEEALKTFDIAVSLLQPDVPPEFYSDKRLAYTRLAEQASFLETQMRIRQFIHKSLVAHNTSEQKSIPADCYYFPILLILVEAGHPLPPSVVITALEQHIKPLLKSGDFEEVSYNDETPRWYITAQRARRIMEKEGLLKSNALHDVWEVSEKGQAYLEEQLKTAFSSGVVVRSTPPQQTSSLNPTYLLAKRVLDVTFTLLILLPLCLVIVFVAVLIRLDSAGPVFYRQKRVGLHGAEFYMFKFRTMYVNNDDSFHRDAIVKYMNSQEMNEGTAASLKLQYKLPDDPRVTRVGRFIRKTSIDELPQFFNILRGEMTLVGPRPPLPYEVELYSSRDLLRFSGKPGLTGVWQVYGRSQVTFAAMVEMDIKYLQQQSLLLDLKLIFLTVPAMIWKW